MVDELSFMPLSKTSEGTRFEVPSQRYDDASNRVTRNLSFAAWKCSAGEVVEALSGRLTHHVHLPKRNGDSYG